MSYAFVLALVLILHATLYVHDTIVVFLRTGLTRLREEYQVIQQKKDYTICSSSRAYARLFAMSFSLGISIFSSPLCENEMVPAVKFTCHPRCSRTVSNERLERSRAHGARTNLLGKVHQFRLGLEEQKCGGILQRQTLVRCLLTACDLITEESLAKTSILSEAQAE